MAKSELDSEHRLRMQDVREKFETTERLLAQKRVDMESLMERDFKIKSSSLSAHLENAARVREAIARNEELITVYSSYNQHPELFV